MFFSKFYQVGYCLRTTLVTTTGNTYEELLSNLAYDPAFMLMSEEGRAVVRADLAEFVRPTVLVRGLKQEIIG